MFSSSFGKAKKIVQIHPRVLPKEHECCECLFFVENMDPGRTEGWCKELGEVTTKYDECSAFVRKE